LKKSGWTLVPAAFFLLLIFAGSSVKVLFWGRLIYFLFFISLFLFLRRFNLDKILSPIVAGVSLVVFSYGLVQKFFLFPYYLRNFSAGDDFYSQALLIRIKSGRIFSLFTLPTLYAIVCALLILFIFHFLIKSPSWKGKSGWILLLTLGLFNLVLTQSFGGVLYLAAGIFLYLILTGIIDLKYLAPILMVFAFFFFLISGLRFSEARKLEPVKLRLSNWHQAVRMIEDKPFFGQGLGNYESEIATFTRPGEARSIYAHNFFLQFAAEIGLFPLVFFIALLFFTRKKWRPAVGREKVVYIAGLVILLLYNLIDIGYYFFPAAMAGVICLSQVYPIYRPRFKPAINLVCLSLFGLLLLVDNLSNTFQQKGDLSLNQKQYAQGKVDYERSLQMNPWNIRSLIGCASLHYFQGDLAASENYLDRVLSLYPDSSYANYLKSRLRFTRGFYFSALFHGRQAYEKNKIDTRYKRWYDSIKNRLQVGLTGPTD